MLRQVARFVRLLQDGGWVAADADPELLATEVFAYVEALSRTPGSTSSKRRCNNRHCDGIVVLLRRRP